MQSIAQFAKRRKWTLRLVAAAIVITLAVMAGGYWLSRRRSETAVRALPPVGKDIQQQASGYTFTRSDEGRQVFTIHASRTVAFKEGGTTVLEGVQVEVFGKDGSRRDVLRTEQCDYNSQSGDLFSSGRVEIELGGPPSGKESGPAAGPVMLETSQLHFHQQGAVVESETPVRFRYGSLDGSAMGLRYATREGRLELLKDVRVEFKSGSAVARPVSLTAFHAQFEKEKGEITLSGGVEVSQGQRRAVASRAKFFLDGRNQLKRAEFEGPIRAVEEGGSVVLKAQAGHGVAEFDPDAGNLLRAAAEDAVEVETRRDSSVSRLTAKRIEVVFAGEHSIARTGSASGGVQMTQSAHAGPPAASPSSGASNNPPFSQRTLSAAEMRFSFQESGKSLRDAETVGPGTIVMLPEDARLGPRTITAGTLRMNFDRLNRLETLQGEGGTRILFEPGKNAPAGSLAQEATADRLLARLDPLSESIQTVDQTGNFHFREGDRHATAAQASYQATKENLVLTGKPQVWDPEMRGRAQTILIDLVKGRAEGVGKVESTHAGGAGRGEPTSVLADRVLIDRGTQTIHYKGNVRAWRGKDVVESAELEILRAERRVSSGSQVLTSHLQPSAQVGGAPAKNGRPQTRPATIRADHLEYLDQGRQAVYRGHVRMQTEDTVLEADRLDAYLRETGNAGELERAVAEGNVKVTQPGRRATGQHAEYFSAEGKIVLIGGPPTLYDADKGFTSGRSLTFYSRDDRVIVSGGDEASTISRHRIGQ